MRSPSSSIGDLHPVDLLVGRDDRRGLLGVHLGQGLDRRRGSAARPRRPSGSAGAARSSSCSEKCSFTTSSLVSISVLSSQSASGRQDLEVLLADVLVAPAGTARSATRPVEDPLEEVRLLAGRVELRLAVAARRSPRTRPCATGPGRRRAVTSWRWLRSRPSAMRRIAASFSTTRRRYGFSRRQFSCVVLGPPALVVAGERGDDLDLVGREAGQVAVRDQVVRVPLVLGVPDVAADVVEERAVLEPLPLGGGQLVERVGLVEELEGEPGDVGRVEHLGVAAPQEPVDAARPHVAVDGDARSPWPGHVVEQEALAQAPLPDDDRVGARPLQDPGEQQAARDRRCRAAAGRGPGSGASPSPSCGGGAC